MKRTHLLAAIALAFGMAQYSAAEVLRTAATPYEEAKTADATAAPETVPNAGQRNAPVEADAPAPVQVKAASAAPSVPVHAAEAVAAPAPDSWIDTFLFDVKLTDVLLAVFTGLLVVLGWIQARRMREAVGAARDSASVALESAKNAEEALVAAQRAFMFIREIKTYLHQDAATGRYHWTIHPVWANSGNTPTRDLSIKTCYRLMDAPLPKDFDFPAAADTPVATIAGPRSMVEAMPGTLSAEDLDAVREGRKFFYLWGQAEYRDIFKGTRQRITRFCNQLVQIEGNPLAPVDEHNPIQMMFGFHPDNNYAD